LNNTATDTESSSIADKRDARTSVARSLYACI